MGTVNYKTSDFITIGYNCNNIDYNDPYYHDLIDDLYYQIEYRLKGLRKIGYYFDVELYPGYYEGFHLDIKFDMTYLSSSEKQEAQKEITQIKAFLLDCVTDFDCVAVYPGWCTGYADYKTTLKEINAAIREMRDTVRHAPTTWGQYLATM